MLSLAAWPRVGGLAKGREGTIGGMETPTLSLAKHERLPRVSIVVPARNAAASIEACIEALLALDYPRDCLEVILVDNASDDETATRIRPYEDRIHLIHERTRGAAAARNTGIRRATNDFIAFTDADCVAHPRWLRELVACALAHPEGDFFGGKIAAYEPTTAVARFAEDLFDQKRAMSDIRLPYAITGNLLVRKAFLAQIGLFDEALLRGHDVDLSYRGRFAHGARFVYADKALVFHANPSTLSGLFREGLKHGQGIAHIARKYTVQRGKSAFRRLIEPKRYARIAKYIALYAARKLEGLFKGRSLPAGEERLLLYDAVFNAGKQIGIAQQMIADLWTPSGISQWRPATRETSEPARHTEAQVSDQ